MPRFVGLMRLCKDRGRFSKRISCCISLPGLVESSYPSRGCALTGRPCTQKRTQLGRQKPAVQQWSQRQSRPELVDIQPTPGPECLFGAIGKDTYSAPLAIARALLRLFQSSAAERSHFLVCSLTLLLLRSKSNSLFSQIRNSVVLPLSRTFVRTPAEVVRGP